MPGKCENISKTIGVNSRQCNQMHSQKAYGRFSLCALVSRFECERVKWVCLSCHRYDRSLNMNKLNVADFNGVKILAFLMYPWNFTSFFSILHGNRKRIAKQTQTRVQIQMNFLNKNSWIVRRFWFAVKWISRKLAVIICDISVWTAVHI